MDLLADIIANTRTSSALTMHIKRTGTWGVAYPSCNVVGVHIMTTGQAWLHAQSLDEPLLMEQGDVVLISQGVEHQVTNDPRGEVECVWWEDALAQPVAPLYTASYMCGAFCFDEQTDSHPVFDALPSIVKLSPQHTLHANPIEATVQLLTAECDAARPGSRTLCERLLDALLVYVLRQWVDEQGACGASWLAALEDPQLGPVLHAMHTSPELEWGMEAWARHAGMSRASFARRFRQTVGAAPMTYLKDVRLSRAGTLLRQSRHDLESIASQVGYASGFSLSRAFKRKYGLAPGHYRQHHQSA